MSRRKKAKESSLELFLDTVCNAFGGIVFITILLSVVLQQRSRTTQVESTDVPVSAREARRLQESAGELNLRYEKLSKVVEQLAPMQPTFEDDQLSELAEKAKARQAELTAATVAQQAAGKELTDQLAKNAELATQLEASKQADAEATEQIAKQAEELKNAVDRKAEQLHLPKLATTAKRQLIVLVYKGKTYPLRTFARVLNKQHIQVLSETVTGFTVLPREDSGWDLDNAQQRADFESYMRSFSSRDYFVNAYVWANAFEEFADLKKWLVARNYDYELDPNAEDGPLSLSFSSVPSMVQ